MVPWAKLGVLGSPYIPKSRRGRPRFTVEPILRIHFMQQWFSLSNPPMEDALHDVSLFRDFAGRVAGTAGWPTRAPS